TRRHADEVLALETLTRRQRSRIECLSLLACALQAGHLPGDSGRAPIRHLAVELMASRLGREEGLRLEGVLDEPGSKGLPRGLRCILRVCLRRRHRCGRRALPAARRQHGHAHQKYCARGPIYSTHSALPACVGAWINMDEESG